jgi:hypothetical protein
LQRPFWRFAVMCDSQTKLPDGMDAHRAVSLVTIKFVARSVAAIRVDVERIALIFEASDRGNKLVERDFDLARMQIANRAGRILEVDGYFMEKKRMEAGLEVADLVTHTAGRQRRHQIKGGEGFVPDFKQMYWHSPIPPAFMAIDNVQLDELHVGR